MRVRQFLVLACLAWQIRLALAVPLEVARELEQGEVRASLQQVRKRAASRAQGLAWASWVWYQARRFQKSWDLAEKSLQEGYMGVEPGLVKSRILLLRGKLDSALAVAQTLRRNSPSVETWGLEGEILRAKGKLSEAAKAFTHCVEDFNALTNPTPEERLQAARAGRLNRDPYGALKHLEVLLERFPWMVRAHYEMGELFVDHYQTGDAALEYRAGLKIRPRSPLLRASLAVALARENSLSKAVLEAKQALEGDPIEPRAWQVLAWVALKNSDWPAAKHAAAKALERNPQDVRFLALQAQVLVAAGEEVEAARVAALSRSINPSNTEIDRVLASQASGKGHEQEALKILRAGLTRSPRSAACFYDRGAIYLRAGRLTAAREDLEKARYLDPFLVKAVNYLKILDRFESFGHYHLRRGLLALSPYGPSAAWPYFQEEVNGLLDSLQGDLDHRLGEGLRVEVFGDVDWMNARALGLGVEFGAGFSFGRCLTFFSAPTEGYSMSWRRTMRHELVHSFNVDRVKPNRVPPWFTEGLATYQEGQRDETAQGILRGAAYLGELSSLQKLIAWKYGGPKLYLHYLQAAIAIEWILDRSGPQGFNPILDLFASGMESKPALEQALGEPLEALAASYQQFLEARVQTLHADMVFRFISDDLLERAKRGEEDARTKVAMFALRTGEADRAGRLLLGISTPEAQRIQARVLFATQSSRALAALLELDRLGPPSYAVNLELGKELLRQGQRGQGMGQLEEAHRLHSGGREAAFLLAKLFREDGQEGERHRILDAYLKQDVDHGWVASELAQDAEKAGDWEAAVRRLRQAIGSDATRPELFLRLARVRNAQKKFALARRAYGAYAGLSRLGLGLIRKGLPLSEQVRMAAEEEAGASGGKPASPPSLATESHWFAPVSLEARTRSGEELVRLLAGEEHPGVALAGLMDSLGRELLEWGKKAAGDAPGVLTEALLGRWGGRPARAAALALGEAGRSEAVGFLLAALSSQEEGPFGRGTCTEHAAVVLEGLAFTRRENLELWWGGERSKSSDQWFQRSLQERGYPDAPGEPEGEAKLLTIVLEDETWFRAQGAWRRLSRLLGTRAGRGGFWGDHFQDRLFEPVRSQARAAFRRVLKGRQLARRRPGRTP
jgi:tetratricopeptide (TPR) repeat protein